MANCVIVLSNSKRRQEESLTCSGPGSMSWLDEILSTLDQFPRYSCQYNINILGVHETDTNKSASRTTALCLKFFKATGVEISCYDIDIAHRIHKRNATPGPRAIVCKFTRRIIKEQVTTNGMMLVKSQELLLVFQPTALMKTRGYSTISLSKSNNFW